MSYGKVNYPDEVLPDWGDWRTNWTVTGLVFMALSRFLWREEVEPRALNLRLPLAVYALNLIWAMVLARRASQYVRKSRMRNGAGITNPPLG